MTVLLQLFWSFLKIGFTSFGGLSMIPLITDEMLSHGWMTLHEVSDIVAIAEMTPGPLGLNCASFAGIRTAGVPGALAANLGVLMPSFTIAVVAAVFFNRFSSSDLMQRIMSGVRPACIAMVIGTCIKLLASNYAPTGATDLRLVILGLIDLGLLLKLKLSIPKVIVLNAAVGLLFLR